jgi:hypothetical protein
MLPPIRHISLAGGAVILIGAAAALLSRRKKKTPAELERERREYLNRHGRIIDGTVLDVFEQPDADPSAPPAQFLSYQYQISGVHYEAAQEVTDLRAYFDVHTCKLGLPASVRYDPHSPENSIVISESWTGLRSGMLSQSPREAEPQPEPQPRLFGQLR